MIWQDYVFTIGGFVFALALLPTVRNPEARVPARTSVSTAAVLTVYVFTQWSLRVHLGAIAGSLTALSWWFIAWKRRTRKFTWSRVTSDDEWTHDAGLGPQGIHYEFVEGCLACQLYGPTPKPGFRGRRFK